MADRKISDLTALTAPAAGDFLPIVDISESLVANKNKRITIEELLRGAPDGTAAAPSIAFESDGGNGFYLAGTDSIGASTNGVNRLTLSTTAFTSTLPFVAPLGAAATPSLTFTGDLNTGIYSPGADQVAISTNGTGRLFVTSLGRVGVNTDSPAFVFQIQHTTEDGIRLRTANTSDAHIDFADTDANGRGRINYDHATDSMGFRTAGAERMRLTSAGLLGLGTSAPSSLLELGGATNGSTLTFSCTSANPATERLLASVDYKTGGYGPVPMFRAFSVAGLADNGSTLRFYTDAGLGAQQERLRIDQAGRVGIGTTSPLFPLDVNGVIYTRGRGSTLGVLFDDWRIYNSTAPGALVFDNGSERARIDSSGRLLVGTSTTSSICTAILQGRSDSTTEAALLRLVKGTTSVADGNGIGTIAFSDSGHVTAATISSNRDGGTWTSGSSQPTRLVFSTTADGASSPTERLRITSAGVLQIADAGNIAVGTTTGTKIGTATTQKLGFFNKTPVVQPTAVADATDAASVITQLNALLSRMRDLGLIAT